MPRKIEIHSLLSLDANVTSLWQGGLLFNRGGGLGWGQRTSSGVLVSYTASSFEMVGVHNKHFDSMWEIKGHPLTQ